MLVPQAVSIAVWIENPVVDGAVLVDNVELMLGESAEYLNEGDAAAGRGVVPPSRRCLDDQPWLLPREQLVDANPFDGAVRRLGRGLFSQ